MMIGAVGGCKRAEPLPHPLKVANGFRCGGRPWQGCLEPTGADRAGRLRADPLGRGRGDALSAIAERFIRFRGRTQPRAGFAATLLTVLPQMLVNATTYRRGGRVRGVEQLIAGRQAAA